MLNIPSMNSPLDVNSDLDRLGILSLLWDVCFLGEAPGGIREAFADEVVHDDGIDVPVDSS